MDSALRILLTAIHPENPDEIEELASSLERMIAEACPTAAQNVQRFPLDNTDAILVMRENVVNKPEAQAFDYLHRFLDEICAGVFSSVYIIRYASVPSDERMDRPSIPREFRILSDFGVRGAITDASPAELGELLRVFIEQLARGAGVVRADSDSRACDALLSRVVQLVDDALPRADETSRFSGAYLLYDESLAPVVLDAVTRSDTTRLQTCLDERVRSRLTDKATLPWVNAWNNVRANGGNEVDPNLPASQRARTFLAAHAIMLATAGVPAIETHELLFPGDRNAPRDGQHFDYLQAEATVNDEESPGAIVLRGYQELLRARVSGAAFHPASPERIAASNPRILAIVRGPWEGEVVVCLHNVSGEPAEFRDRRDRYPWPESGVVRDLLSDDLIFPTQEGSLFSLELQPWEAMWLQFGTDLLTDDSVT